MLLSLNSQDFVVDMLQKRLVVSMDITFMEGKMIKNYTVETVYRVIGYRVNPDKV